MRRRRMIALTSALAMVPAYACAGSDEAADEPPKQAFEPAPVPPVEGGAAADATDDVPVASLKGCSDDGFCYVPVPRSMPLIAVSASSIDDAWMLPEASGALFRWDGSSIRQVYEYDGATPSSITFVGISAQTRDSVWGVARGSDENIVVVRYASPPSGGPPAFRELVTQQPATSAMAQWATPAGDALWLTTDGSVLRIREAATGPVVEDLSPPGDEDDLRGYRWRGIWGFGPDDVYVAGMVCPSRPCGQQSQGAIAHYDGVTWSIATVESTIEVTSLRGTPPGGARRLWYVATDRLPGPPVKAVSRTDLVPLESGGSLGAPIYSHADDREPACSARIGRATGPSAGWFSSGLLLCRWTGKELEPVGTAVDGRQIVESLNGIWADGPDDVWVVGAAVTRPELPRAGFAARRTAATAQGGTP